ncbi:efflux RND transporter periplasmic adaptor subunit [Pseudoalteromonas sp.]|uniref:efflux RND transporter periplasmic adaptor subunit n=1 Tax=Pseudoalteromonas sp. TaxID=53249 RepID=UPI003566555A
MYAKQSGKALFPLISIILFGLCTYLYLPESQGQQNKRETKATPVQAHTVSTSRQANMIESLGTARANQAITLVSAQSDYIKDIHFDDGDKVQKGQLLIELQDAEEKTRVEELEILLKEENRKLKRLQQLAKTQATARSALDEQEASFEATKTQLASAKIKLSEMKLYAPFSGTLGLRNVSKGTFVNSSTEITTLDDTSIIKTDFNVPEKYLAQLSIDMTVTATSPAYPTITFSGKVSHIASRIDSATRSVKITASFDNKDNALRTGMLLYTLLELSAENTLMVPEKSLIPQQDKHFVYVINKDKIEKRQVVIGIRRGGWVAIGRGLTEGEVVVTEGIIKVRPGSLVSVKEMLK